MGKTDEEFERTIKDPIRQTIVHTMESVRDKLNKDNRQFCFEIYGFDYIVDRNE